MNERKGEVFSIAEENAPAEGCTVSKAVAEVAGRRISHFALSAGTDISPETYDYHKLWIVMNGEGRIGYDGKEHHQGGRELRVRAAYAVL